MPPSPHPPTPIRNTDFGDYTGLAFHGDVLVPVSASNSNSTGDNPAGANSSFDLYTTLVQVTTAQVAPAVTTQPAPVTVAAGSPFSFVVGGVGTADPDGPVAALERRRYHVRRHRRGHLDDLRGQRRAR